MKRASKRIIVTSENVNRYGFRVLTDGIDLVQYEKNPICLWMHNRAFGTADKAFLPIGNVIELRKEEHPELGKVITGLPVFDDTDDFAMRIYNKYENGTLRMGSAGLIPVEWSEDEKYLLAGQRAGTLVKSILEEISIVDIGANNDALSVALYNENHELIKLSLNGENAEIPLIKNPLIEIEMNKIELTAERAAILLGLKTEPTAGEFITKVAELVQLAQTQKTQIETLTRDKSELQQKIDDADKVALAAKVESLVQLAVDGRKITADEKPTYIALATADYANVEKLLGAKAGAPTAQEVLAKSKTTTDALVQLCAKGYDELFASGDLEAVKLNAPEDYKRIYKDKFGKEPKNV